MEKTWIGHEAVKMRKLTPSGRGRYRFSSIDMSKPGLLELLFKRSFVVSMADYTFHIGLYGSIVTGALAELSNLVSGFAALFKGFGWLISWSHGIAGIFLIVGGIAFFIRFLTNPHFRVAYGRIFYLDFLFLLAIAISGTLQASVVFGLIPVYGFTAYPLSWVGTIHVTAIYAWIVASLFLGGAVRHAIGTVMWRLTNPENKHALFLAFSDACGRCGRCVEVCPLYEAMSGAKVEAPALKIRRYYKMIATRSLPASEIRSIAEQIAVCTMCGLCVGVCPFSFNFVDMYKELLAYANKVLPMPIIGELAAPHAV
jgi:ferredoxin